MKQLLGWFLLFLALPTLAAAGDDAGDPSNWTPIKIAGKQQMPEFSDITGWINSEPLTPAELQGKVVVVHFMVFG